MKAEKEYKKGLWTQEEDRVLLEYVRVHGRGQWNRIPKVTGLKRCGKSCRLRWLNYLSPCVKHGDFSEEEEDLIIRLHNLLGNRWSLIAGRVPGRTDNQVKNHWNTHLRKKLGINNYKKRKNRVFNSSKPQSNDSHRPADDNDDDDDLNNEHLQNGQLVMDVKSDGEAELMNHQHNHEPFLLPTDDIFNLYSPELLGLLDGYPFDLVWLNN